MRLDHKFWKWAQEQPEYDGALTTWIDYWEGCVQCACDHGCNQFILDNAAKAGAIMRAISTCAPQDELDAMALKDEKEFRHELWQRMYREGKTT